MNRFRSLFSLVLAFLIAVSMTGAPIQGQKKSSSSNGTSTSAEAKTVHVKEYTRKDGTTVAAHDRKAPSSTGSSSGASTKSPSTTSTTARTTTASPASTTAKSTTTSSTSTTHPATYCQTCARDAKGRILRAESAKAAFQKATGFPHGRPGYVVDHITPLACGGADDTSNMQWQTAAQAKAKDKWERSGCR